MEYVNWIWEKFGFCSITRDGAKLHITIDYPFASGFVIGAITGVALW